MRAGHGRSRRAACAVIAAAALAAPATAAASGPAAPAGLSERALKTFETRVLGPEHAAEHAQRRALLRDPKLRAMLRNDARRVRARARALRGPRARTADAAQDGEWAAPFRIPVLAISTAVLPTGKVLMFAYPKNPSAGTPASQTPNSSVAYLWDPATGRTRRVDPPTDPRTGQPANIWCSGLSFLPDGRLLVTGGNLAYDVGGGSGFRGLNAVYTFDPFTETWAEQPKMRAVDERGRYGGRWYPTQTLLPDGRTLITSGYNEAGNTNKSIEVFSAAPGARGTVSELLGGPQGRDVDGDPGGYSTPLKGLYPHVFVAPDGRVIFAGPYMQDSFALSLFGGRFGWFDLPNPAEDRYWGAAILEPDDPGKILQVGGAKRDPDGYGPDGKTHPWTGTRVLDTRTNTWGAGAALNTGRAHNNTLALPDGTLATVGGGFGNTSNAAETPGANGSASNYPAAPEHRRIELRDPATGQWRLGPAESEYRTYHSTAVLLPDGRVMSAGDDLWGGYEGGDPDTAELYSPPYLFRGGRPVIASAPGRVEWGSRFFVGTSGDVASAALVAPSATTHGNDMSARRLPLAVTKRAGGVELAAPADGRLAPPGYYMLFVMDARGVPSAARWVLVGPEALTGPVRVPVTNVTPPATPAPAPAPIPISRTAPGAPGGPVLTTGVTDRFEAGRGAWRAGTGRLRVVTGGHGGRRALELKATTRRAGRAARTLPALAAGTYTVTAWVRGKATLRITQGTRVVASATGRGSGWRRLTLRLRVTAGARPALELRAPARRTVRLDDVTVRRS